MKLKIKTVEEIAGKTINPFWKFPMYLVNGAYVASSISAHNIDGLAFSLEVGEVADVSLRAHNGDMWIARSDPMPEHDDPCDPTMPPQQPKPKE